MEKTDKDLNRLEEECASNEYILLYMPKHPTANKAGYVPQHRYVVERDLGRYLLPTEIVHHIDLDKTNNDRSNLLLFETQGDHIRFHNYNYPAESIDKLIEEGLIVKNVNNAFKTVAIDKYKCVCKYCGDVFSSETRHNTYCSRICFRNAMLGNEMPTKEQLLDWLDRGYSRYKLLQLLDVSEATIDAYFAHYDINYAKYKKKKALLSKKKKSVRDKKKEIKPVDRLGSLKINIRDKKTFGIMATITGMENFIDWLLNNGYTHCTNDSKGRGIVRNKIYQGLYKNRASVYGFIIDSPNIIKNIKPLGMTYSTKFATQQQYNLWVEKYYAMYHKKEVKMVEE